MRFTLLPAAVVLLVASSASAQISIPAPLRSGFVNINFGGQAQSDEFPVAGSFPLYEEAAIFDVQHLVRGGPLFEIGGGFRVWEDLSVGMSYARRFKDTRDSMVNAIVPNPIFTDTYRAAAGLATDLEHSERAVHLQAMWRVPVTEEFDVSLFLGPSFFSVTRDIVESVSVAEAGGDFSTVDVTGITTRETSDGATGINLGVDGTYMVTPRFGGGLQLRFSRASVKLPLAGGDEAQIDAGGFDVAFGIRYRF